MGRMFRIISEGGPDASVRERIAQVVDEVPFVEVGGPEGVVTSQVSPQRVVLSRPELVPTVAVTDPEPEPEPEAPPRPSADPRVLSVAFHRLPKGGLRLVPTGVATDLVAYHFPDHPVSLEYQAVRDEIRGQFDAPGPRVVAFTAAASEAGTTTVVLNSAASLVRDGGKVLVVDAHFARPAVAPRLGVSDAPGLAEVLRQSTPLAWAVQPTAVDRLHAVAAGNAGGGVPDVGLADLPRLLEQLRQWFDWVLIDAGVWAELDGRDGLAPATDAVYLVSRVGNVDAPAFTGLRAAVGAAGGVPRGYITTRY